MNEFDYPGPPKVILLFIGWNAKGEDDSGTLKPSELVLLGSPTPGVVLEARPLKLPPPTAIDLCLCIFSVYLNGFAWAAKLGVNPPSFFASFDPPERAEFESALSRGTSLTLAAFKSIPPPLAES